MNTLLVNTGAARKLRSLFFLLFMVGVVNVASATTYYTSTTTAASVSSTYVVTGTLYSAAANGGSVYTNPTITSADLIIVVGAALTTSAPTINIQATSGSLTVSLGTATITAASTFSGAVVVGTVGSATAGLTINATLTLNINGDLTVYNGATVTLNTTTNAAGGASVTVGTGNGIGNLIMLGGTVAMSGNANIGFYGNLAGSANAATPGWGLITGYQTNSYIYFLASGNYGTGSASQTSATFTGVPVPQLVNFTYGSGLSAAAAVTPAIADANSLRVSMNGYVKLVANSVLPTASRMMSSTTTQSCIDLNGYSLAVGYFASGYAKTPLVSGGAGTGGNSILQLNGSSRNAALGLLYVNSASTSVNTISLNMQMANASASFKFVQLNTSLTLGSSSTLSTGIVYLDGYTVTAASFPTASATSYFSVGSTTVPSVGGTILVTSPSTTSTATVVPLGYGSTTAGTTTYTPISFANTTGSPTLTVGVSALNTTSITGASSSGTTITCASTAGVAVGATLTFISGTGVFNGATTVASVTDATHFVLSIAPTTALSAGSTIQAVNNYTNSNVFGNGASASFNTVSYQWTIASSASSVVSDITFQYPSINSGFNTPSPSTAAQLGVILPSNSTGFNAIASTTSLTLTGSSVPYTAKASTFTLPGAANTTNTYVIGNSGAVISTGGINSYWIVGGISINGTAVAYTTASITGASSSSTTITCASTTGLYVNEALTTVTAGTGTLTAGTYITSITDGTHFVVNTAPSIALSGATVTVSSALYTNSGLLNYTTTATIQTTDLFNLTTSGSSLTTATSATTLGGITMGAGSVTLGTAYTGAIAASGGTLTVAGGSLTTTQSMTCTLALSSGTVSLGANLTGNVTVSGTGALTVTATSTITGNLSLSGTGSVTTNGTTTVTGDLTIGNGTTVTLGTNGMTVSGNLYMTGGTLALAGNNLNVAGNFEGSSAPTQATGTITGTATTGTITFTATGNLGTSGTVAINAVSASCLATLGTGYNPQKIWANISTAGTSGTGSSPVFIITTAAQLVGNTVFPTNARMRGGNPGFFDLNGYSFSVGYFLNSSNNNLLVRGGGTAGNGNAVQGTSNSVITLNGPSSVNFGSQIYFDNAVPGTTNLVNFSMNEVSGNAGSKIMTLNSNLSINSNSVLSTGNIYLNGYTLTGSSFPTGSATSCIAEGTSAINYAAGSTTGGTIIVTNPSTTSIIVPIGYSTGGTTAASATYTPVSFANTTGSPASYTVAVAPLITTDVITSANCIQNEWYITSSTASVHSDITFGATSATGIASGSQLGVLTTGNTGYTNITTNLATASSFNATTFIATFNGYTLPANTTANSFVVGTSGAVYPLPTLSSIPTTTSPLNSSVNIGLTGTNISSFTSSGKPSWLTLNYTNSTTGSLTGTAQSTGSSTSITINANNVAGTASQIFTYTEANAPNITSATTATALVGGSLNYAITTSSSATSYGITGSLPTGLSFNTSTGVISGTLSAGTAGSYPVGLSASGPGGSSTAFTLTIQVLDVPTVTSISPATGAVNIPASGTFSITVTGTNFVSGYSTVTWAGSSTGVTSVSVTDATHITANIDYSLVAGNVASSTPAVGVTNARTNASPTTPATVSSASNTTPYTITVATPTVTAVSPAASVIGGPTMTVTLTGLNFISGVSAVTFAGSTTGVTTTYVSATSLTATLSSSVFASAGTKVIGVTNSVGNNLSVPATVTTNFTVYADGAVWTLSSGTPTTATSSNVTAGTLTIASGSTTIKPFNTTAGNTSVSFTASGLKYTPALTGAAGNASVTWPVDDVNTINTLFDGVVTTTGPNSYTRYIEFDVPTKAGYNFTVNNITLPITNFSSTVGFKYSIAYSFDGFTTSGGVHIMGTTPTLGNGALYNYTYTTPIIVPDGTTLSVRVIPYTAKNTALPTSFGTTPAGSYIYVSNVVIAGTTSASYGSPVFSPAVPSTVNGDAAITYTSGSPLYTIAATTVSGHAPSYSATGLSGTGYSLDATTGAITGTSATSGGGNFNVTFTADNGNLFPTVSSAVNFIIDGIPLTPTTTSISPTTGAVDGVGFTITVNGTNFVSGKSAVTWNGTALTTTYVSATQLTATVPASLVAGSSISSGTATPSVGVYNTGAVTPASNNQTYTITNITPTLIALSPCGINAGNTGFTLSIYGTNFTSASKITWNGTLYGNTTFVSTRQITANISASDVATAGSATVGVTNVFPSAGSLSSAATINFIIGNATSTWSTTSLTPSTTGSVVGTNTTLNGAVVAATIGGIYSYGQTTSTAYSGDGGNATPDATFVGLSTDNTTTSTIASTRSIDFKVTPATQKDMTISAITIPMYTNGNAMWYSVGYSTDGVNFTKISTASNSVGLTVTPPVGTGVATTGGSTNDIQLSYTTSNNTPNTVVTNYVFATPLSVTSGNTFTLRVIVWRKGGSTTSTVNIGSVSIVGNTTTVATPYAPAITSLADGSTAVDVSFTAPSYTGTSAITSYKVYAYANGSTTAATSVSANVSSLTLPYHINVTGLTNGTSYAFKVSATNASGEGALSALSSTVVPSNTTTWTVTGGIGSWDHGDPDLGDQNAVINGNFALTKALSSLKLTVASGVTVSTNNFNFTVAGNFDNNGTISGTGTLLLNTTAAQTITGIGTVGNITINNTSGGVSVTSGSNMLNITGVLTLQTGVLTTNSNVTFKSTSIANTGILAAIDGTINTGSVSGTVVVERYIPAGFRAYRDLAPEVNNAGTVFNNWQEGGLFTSGKGIFITGPSSTDAVIGDYSTQPSPNATTGLDYSINGNASAFTYTNSTASWNSGITNTKTTSLYPFSGYRVLVRGDRSFNLATTPIVNYYNLGLRMVNATVLRATGNLVTGTVTYATSGVTNASVGSTYQTSAYGLNGTTNLFSMIANPYVCPILWGTGTGTNSSTTTVYGASSGINGSYWYLDPTYTATGTYLAYNALTGFSSTGSSNTHVPTGYIQPGQAVFVQTSASSPTVVFKETAKASSSTKTSVFGATTSLSKIYVSLDKLNATTGNYNRMDGAAMAFSEGFTNVAYGPQDAVKFGNTTDNLYITDKGMNLSIDGRLPATASDQLPLAISKVSGTAYQLVVDANDYVANGFAPYLVDSYKGTTTALTSGVNTISFAADASIAASFATRFSIAFKPTTLAVNSMVASATFNNKIATINWNTVGEKGVSRFEVEKSTDAKAFTKIGQATAKNTATASYTTTDNTATAATTYYRIKAISEVGTVSYSNVAKLTTNNSPLTTFSLYPNPLKGGSKVLNITMGNVAASKYTVTITSVLGQKVHEEAISHQGGSASHAITITNTLAAGTYSITVRDASNQSVYQSNISVQP